MYSGIRGSRIFFQLPSRYSPANRLNSNPKLAWLPFVSGADPEPRIDRLVWLVDFDGPLGPATADLIIRSIDDAAAVEAEALIIRMDTPGGLDKSMRELVQEIPQLNYRLRAHREQTEPEAVDWAADPHAYH